MPWETGKAQRPGSPSVLRGLGRLTNVAAELLPPSAGETQHPPPAPSSSAAPAGSLPAPSPMPGPVTSVAQGTFSPAGHPRHQSCMEHRLGFQSPWQTPADLRSPQPRIRLSLLTAGPADLVGFRPNTREGRLAANFPPASGIV